jgi:hypothetical protein
MGNSTFANRNPTTQTPFPAAYGFNTPGFAQPAQQDKAVDIRNYRQLTTYQTLSLQANIISGQSPDNKKRFITIRNILKATKLLSMVTGERRRPVMTEQNPHGYRERCMTVPNDFSTMIEADDVYHWIHDYERLFALTMLCFHTHLHYLCGDAIAKGDGIEVVRQLIISIAA